MAIPDYQTVMLPLLSAMRDGHERSLKDCVQILSEVFKLTAEEQRELLPGGGQPTFHNRVGWARTYLKKAGLLESPRRSFIKISPRGLDVLKKGLKKIDVKFLAQFPEFVEFQGKKSAVVVAPNALNFASDKSPEESMHDSFQHLHRVLAAELLDQIRKYSSEFFERLVVDLLVKMGYGGTLKDAGLPVGKSGDGGIDGFIKEDRLGLDQICLQAKRWDANVGRPQLQAFVGALHGKGNKGVFITTSEFTPDAKEYARTLIAPTKVILIDGEQPAELMIEHNLGVSVKKNYEIKKIDSDYFSEEE